jgi:hypothetical protein
MRASIAKLVQSAIVTVGDIAETITYNAKTSGTYDPNTGEISENTTVYSLNAVISPIKRIAVDSHFPAEVIDGITSDLSILFASIDLPITPNTGDTITREIDNYKIIKIMKDPAGASTELYVAKIG